MTAEQIREMDLPLRPTKKTDSRAKHWEGGSVEVEAIPPDVLRSLVEEAISRHVDEHQWEIVKIAEASERKLLKILPQGRFSEMEIEHDGEPGEIGHGYGEIILPFGPR